MDAVVALGLHVVTKLRHDANLRFRYTGPRTGQRGRPKTYDSKVNWRDLSRFDALDRSALDLAPTQPEQIVTLSLPLTSSTRAFVAQHDLPTELRVRLVRVLLASGEVEVLLTTLCDAAAYPAQEFQTVYGARSCETK